MPGLCWLFFCSTNSAETELRSGWLKTLSWTDTGVEGGRESNVQGHRIPLTAAATVNVIITVTIHIKTIFKFIYLSLYVRGSVPF